MLLILSRCLLLRRDRSPIQFDRVELVPCFVADAHFGRLSIEKLVKISHLVKKFSMSQIVHIKFIIETN